MTATRTTNAAGAHALSDAAARHALIGRLHRAEGQLHGVAAMVEQGRPCNEVVVQLMAVSKAVERAALQVVTENLRECVASGDLDLSTLADDLAGLLRPMA